MRWALRALRAALCVAAVAYLVWAVPWHDQVRLTGPPPRWVRLVEDAGAQVRIADAGGVRTVPRAALARLPDGQTLEVRAGIAGVVRRTRAELALLALLLFAPVPLIQAVRLVWMLRIQQVRLRHWDAVKLTYAGNFFNFALPGTTGGDLVKAWYITHFTHRKTEAVTTVFLDRVVGLVGLTLLAGGTWLAARGQVGMAPELSRAVGAGLAVVAAGLAGLLVALYSDRLRERVAARIARLPAGQQLLRIGRATLAMRPGKALVAAALLNTLVLQVFVILSAFVMARALGMSGGFALYFVCVPIGFLVAAAPVAPPQAVGVLEWAYIQFFAGPAGNDASQAVAFALSLRLIQLVWALPGLLVPLLGAHRPDRAALRDLETLPAAPAGSLAGPPVPGGGPRA